MEITVNGLVQDVPDGTTCRGLVAQLTGAAPAAATPGSADTRDPGPGEAAGIAVAVDGAVVPRSGWAATQLRPGQRVDVVTAVQGG